MTTTENERLACTLSRQEMEVLKRIAEGKSNTQIAAELFIVVRTVENHIRTIFLKLQLKGNSSQMHARVMAARMYWEEIEAHNMDDSCAGHPVCDGRLIYCA